MFTTPFPSLPEVQAHTVRAHRIRSAVVGGLIRDLARLFAAAAR
jgi:hypothetical protein